MSRRHATHVAHLLHTLYTSVGLRGEYPIERLLAFSEFNKRVSNWRVLWVLLRSCMPPLLLLIAFDLMPLSDPSDGWCASPWFWVRTAANGSICSAGILVQMNHFVLAKPLSFIQMLAIMTGVSIGCTSTMLVLASQWVFPIPFTTTLSGLPFVVFFNGFLLLTVGTRDRNVLTKILRFTNIVGVQTSMVLVYPTFHAAFLALDPTSQVVSLAVLPVIKIAYKLVIARISAEFLDLQPAIIASVDLFNTLYITKCMQSAGAIWVGVAAIALDVLRNYVALSSLIHRFQVLHGHIAQLPDGPKDLFEQISSLLARNELLRMSSLRLESTARLPVSPVSRAELERLKEMRRDELRTAKVLVGSSAAAHGPRVTTVTSRVVAVHLLPATHHIGLASIVPFNDAETPILCVKRELAKQNTQLLREAMRLVYEIEAVVLVEYIEAVVPVFYGVYLVILFHLPNAKYYQDVSDFTAEKLTRVVITILIYAVMEFLSLVHVNEVLKRNFGVSAFHQLAFTLELEWRIFQSNFNSWIVFIFQFLLAHNGVDFSFKFAWLRASHSTTTT